MEGILPLYLLLFLAFNIWCYFRILKKTGRSPWWSLIILVPFVNVIMIWVFAFARWPTIDPPEEELPKDWSNPSWRTAGQDAASDSEPEPHGRTSVPPTGKSNHENE